MTTRILLVASVVAWVAALVGLVWMVVLAEIRPRYLPWLLIHMDIVLQACAVLSVVSAVIGILGVRAGARRRAVTGFSAAFGWGVLGGVLGMAGARVMLINMNPPIPFYVYAPGYAQAFLVLLVGLTGAILGLVLLGRRGPAEPRPPAAGP
ncbi:hypothetical protein N0B44_26210 [Roseibacterium beibuensis]|uniref:hypothetical protein n=1 Tax=[Roseibacterium] beibuensis TaxID=1193142 RepID=UPI00217D1BDC|nr:hypothetical protein [Roseibacterium beibuensis]MCS6626420.1 hypothetical protein [Roseibacterium beibuensis]